MNEVPMQLSSICPPVLRTDSRKTSRGAAQWKEVQAQTKKHGDDIASYDIFGKAALDRWVSAAVVQCTYVSPWCSRRSRCSDLCILARMLTQEAEAAARGAHANPDDNKANENWAPTRCNVSAGTTEAISSKHCIQISTSEPAPVDSSALCDRALQARPISSNEGQVIKCWPQ